MYLVIVTICVILDLLKKLKIQILLNNNKKYSEYSLKMESFNFKIKLKNSNLFIYFIIVIEVLNESTRTLT